MDLPLDKCYQILGLKSGASSIEIKQAYLNLAKIWHPDRFINQPQDQAAAAEKFKQINQAYERLKNELVFPSSHSFGGEAFGEDSASGFGARVVTRLDNPQDHYDQAVFWVEQNQLQGAIEELGQAIQLQGDFIQAYQYRAFLYEKLGYHNRAASDFQKVKILRQATPTSPGSAPPQSEKSQPQASEPSPQAPAPASESPPSPSFIWHCYQTLLAHWKSVSALAIDPTGQTLVSASHDGTIKLWDLHQGQCITTLSRSKGQIWDLAISNDGQWLVVGGTNPRLQVWNLATRKVEQSLGDLFSGHRDPVRVVEFSADDQLIFSAGVKRSCKCWHRASGNLAYQLKALTVPLTTIAPSPQGNLLAVSGTNQRLQIRDLPTGALLQEMTLSHSGLVLQFSPNGRLLAIGLANGEIQIYTVDDTGQRGEPWQRAFSLPGHRANVSALIFSPDGTVLTSSGWDGTIKSWDLQTQRAVCTARGHQDDQIMALALSGDGKTLVSGGADRQICLWYRGLPNF